MYARDKEMLRETTEMQSGDFFVDSPPSIEF
jgi:hypothetical protein